MWKIHVYFIIIILNIKKIILNDIVNTELEQ